MTAPHLPAEVPLPPTPRSVVPLGIDLGSTQGQRIILLSLETWEGWADLRFARIDVGATQRLTRRIPPAAAWSVTADGEPVEVVDAVGRGDRTFSNGEVRLVPAPALDATLQVTVEVVPGAPALTAGVTLFDIAMSTSDTIKDKAKDEAKEATGTATGDREQETEGETQHTKGRAKESTEDLGDRTRGAVKGIRGDDSDKR